MSRFPFKIINDLMNQGDNAATNTERGNCLEEAIVKCFDSLTSLKLMKRQCLSANGAQEIDVLFFNAKSFGHLPFLDNAIIIECKNWNARVNAASIRDFQGKLTRARVQHGILVASNGVTGDPHQLTAARAEIRDIWLQHGIRIIVITRSDLCGFKSQDDLIDNVQEAWTRFLVGENPF